MNWQDVRGYFSKEDAEEYARLASAIPDMSLLVEIGSFNGRSLASIAEIIKRKKLRVWSVDLWGTWEADFLGTGKYTGADGGNIKADRMLIDFAKTMTDFGLEPLIFCGTSAKVASEMACFPSLVFIDADHNEEAVRADIAAWWPKILPYGYMAGHDYHPTWPGVARAVEAEFKGRHKVGVAVWSVRKGGV